MCVWVDTARDPRGPRAKAKRASCCARDPNVSAIFSCRVAEAGQHFVRREVGGGWMDKSIELISF
jgi:hypothetical protein